MKVRLKVLLNEPRDGAWPPSVRAVRCPVKSGNEQDLYLHLLASHFGVRALCRDCLGNKEEGVGNGGLYASNLLGYTRATMAGTMGYNSERRSQASKPSLSSD